MKRYADDYVNENTVDGKGRERKTAVYRGTYFRFLLDEQAYQKTKLWYILLTAGLVVILVGMGFIANKGMYKIYVALPYTLCYFPLLYLVMGIIRLPAQASHLRRDQVGLSLDRVKTTSLVLLIFLAVGLVGEVAYVIFFAQGVMLEKELPFIALQLLALGGTLAIWLSARHIQVDAEPETSGSN